MQEVVCIEPLNVCTLSQDVRVVPRSARALVFLRNHLHLGGLKLFVTSSVRSLDPSSDNDHSLFCQVCARAD